MKRSGQMELQEIDVYIDENGQVRLEVRGVKGQGCLELTKDLEAALGGAVEERRLTPEAFEGTHQCLPEQQWLGGT